MSVNETEGNFEAMCARIVPVSSDIFGVRVSEAAGDDLLATRHRSLPCGAGDILALLARGLLSFGGRFLNIRRELERGWVAGGGVVMCDLNRN